MKIGSCGECGYRDGRDQGMDAEYHDREFGSESGTQPVKVTAWQLPT